MTSTKRFKTVVAEEPKAIDLLPQPIPVPVDPTVKRHIFETAKLGKAPFLFLGVTVRSTSCQYCGTPIVYQFWLQGADGKRFFVGSDCIYKSGDAGLRSIVEPIVKKHEAELRDKRETDYIQKFEAYLAQHPGYWQTLTGPHPYPYYARQGRTLGDYQSYVYKHAGRAKKARIARGVLIGLGIVKGRTKKALDNSSATK